MNALSLRRAFVDAWRTLTLWNFFRIIGAQLILFIAAGIVVLLAALPSYLGKNPNFFQAPFTITMYICWFFLIISIWSAASTNVSLRVFDQKKILVRELFSGRLLSKIVYGLLPVLNIYNVLTIYIAFPTDHPAILAIEKYLPSLAAFISSKIVFALLIFVPFLIIDTECSFTEAVRSNFAIIKQISLIRFIILYCLIITTALTFKATEALLGTKIVTATNAAHASLTLLQHFLQIGLAIIQIVATIYLGLCIAALYRQAVSAQKTR